MNEKQQIEECYRRMYQGSAERDAELQLCAASGYSSADSSGSGRTGRKKPGAGSRIRRRLAHLAIAAEMSAGQDRQPMADYAGKSIYILGERYVDW